jgi:hypothetical protein
LSPMTIGGLPVPGKLLALDDELPAELELPDELLEELDELPQAASITAAASAINVPRTRAM